MPVFRPSVLTRPVTTAICATALLWLYGSLFAQTRDDGEISRAQFSTLVSNREPVDTLTATNTDIGKLYFFTEVINMTGKVIIHRWRYFDEIVAEIPFSINGPRWRVNSYKNFTASMSGEWSVELVDDKGRHYGEHTILVKASNQAVDSQSDSAIDKIRKLFPDTEYTLLNNSLAHALCPPGGEFKWQNAGDQLWTLDMGTAHPHIRVYDNGPDTAPLREDPDLSLPGPGCLMYSGHHFNADNAELVTELQADCEGESNDVFSAKSLRRVDGNVELTIYAEELVVCRYQVE